MSTYILEIDTSINNNTTNSVTVQLIDSTIVDVINNTTVLVSDLPEGYPLDWTIGNLPVSRISGLDVVGGSGVGVVNNSGIYTVSVTGTFGLTGEEVDDRIGNLLVGGSYTNLNYNDNNNTLTISVTGLQPSGNYSLVNHTHSSSDITNFNSSVSGLLPVKNISSGSGIAITNNSGDFAVSVTGQFGLTSEQVDDRISELLLATNYITLNYNDSLDKLIIGTSGLQPSGNYSVVGHSHQISDVSGLQTALDNKQPSGSYAPLLHTHSSNDITDFSGAVNILVSGVYAPLNSPNFTGTPLVPTAPSGTNNGQIANTQFVRTEISNLVNSAPSTLDTLNELATALGNDPNFATSVASGLATKSNIGHTHNTSDISDFGSSVSGLLPITNITGSSGVLVTNSGTVYNISSSGLAYLSGADFSNLSVGTIPVSVSGHSHSYTDIVNWASGIENEVSTLLVPGNYININYDNIADTLTISASGLQPSGNYANSVHTHGNISNSGTIGSTSGLLVTTGSNGTLTTSSTISSSYISNFNSSVSGLLPSIAGSGYVNSTFNNNTYTINVSGLQPSGNYSLVGHNHLSSEITDFNSSVSGLLPVKNIVAGTGIGISSTSGIYTINSTVSGVAESASLVTNVFNKTPSTINKGSVVYINGGQGDQPTIQLAIASTEMGSSKTYGIVQNNIPSMSVGKVVVAGALTAFNTDQFNPTAPTGDVNGTTLWLSPSVSGTMTTTKPSAPYHMVSVGTIVRTHQNEGVIEVRIQNGYELEELHNVAISGVTNGQFLQYNGSGLWVPSSSGNFSTLLVNNSGVSLQGHSHSSSDITDFNSSVSGLIPVTNIFGGSNITISQSGSEFTVAVTGSLGLTTEEVDDRVSNLLVAGTGIGLNYDDNANTLTIAVSGLSSTAIIGNGSGNVISYNLNEALNVVGSGSTTVTYNDSTNTINISSPSLIREYELVSSTKSTFTVTGGYALNNLDVYHNGIKLLASGDYSATNGTSFTLVQPAVSGDVVEWLGYSVVPRHQLILGEVRSDTLGNINYLGRAVAGSSEASAVWTIKRYTIADNGIDITTSTASSAIWNNRLTETYL